MHDPWFAIDQRFEGSYWKLFVAFLAKCSGMLQRKCIVKVVAVSELIISHST